MKTIFWLIAIAPIFFLTFKITLYLSMLPWFVVGRSLVLAGKPKIFPSSLPFPGAMSLAGAQGNLWSVEGGNKLVCSGLLKLAKASVIHATVTSVTLHTTGE